MSEEGPAPSIERIAHTGGSPEGTNSTYVLPDHGLVVDPGPPGEEAWETLVAGLSTTGLSATDVEAVVVSHWHADHAGLGPRLAEDADAELILHAADAPLVRDYANERAHRIERDARRLREWGVPDRVVDAIRDGDNPSPMPDQTPVTAVANGDRIQGVEAVHTPGHTAGHLALEAGDALLLGDAVLPTYTPNVGGSDTRMDDPLSAYLNTLDRLSERSARAGSDEGTGAGPTTARAFPGHGSSVELRPRIAEIREHHARRLLDVVRTLPDGEGASATAGDGRTPWQVACDCFGEMRGIHAKMGSGEAAAHLRFAVERGLAVPVGSGPEQYIRGSVEATEERAARAVSASRYR